MATINRLVFKEDVVTDGKVTRAGNKEDFNGPIPVGSAAKTVTITIPAAPNTTVITLQEDVYDADGNLIRTGHKITYTGTRG